MLDNFFKNDILYMKLIATARSAPGPQYTAGAHFFMQIPLF